MKFILGKKLGMTQIFRDNGEVVPVTKVLAGPCQVIQVKTKPRDNHTAIQIGFGVKRAFRIDQPTTGHLKGLELAAEINEFPIDKTDGIVRGDIITVATFAPGDIVNVVGTSKGKGFAGVVKRHHFRGAPASHGHKHDLRAPGSIGAGGVQRVFKGMRMGGHMGVDRVTIKNLEIVGVNPEANELLIKGAVPGGRNSILQIFAAGALQVQKVSAPEAPVAPEATTTEPTTPEVVTESVESVVQSA